MRSKRLAASIAALTAAAAVANAWDARAAESPVALTTEGQVIGRVESGNAVFRGIPYAASAAGANRWRPPQPAPKRAQALDAGAFGPICTQAKRPDGVPAAGGDRVQSEDCLSLNVWAPPSARKAPVMVWIHGGAHRFGSGTGPVYDGTAFARDGIVFVTINYRLGAFGYFAHPALTRAASGREPLGSYGLMDQMAALKWVSENIAAFGGDPSNVTVFGESAGGSSILSLLSTPGARNLFQKAIVESGGGWQGGQTLETAERAGVDLAAKAGVPENATPEALRAIPASALLVQGGGPGSVGPIVDGRLTPLSVKDAFAANAVIDVPLMIGSNSYEASLLRAFPVPSIALLAQLSPDQRRMYGAAYPDRDAAAHAAYTDVVMGAPARWIAARAAGGAPSYLYHFSYVASAQRATSPGAVHAAEIPYVFETGSKLGRAVSSEDRAMEKRLHACWVAFAKTGRPSCPDTPAWPAYSPAKDQLIEFGVETALRSNFRKPFLDAAEAASTSERRGRRLGRHLRRANP